MVTTTRFSPEEIGYLAGGPTRSAETALARLLQAGLIRVSRSGDVSAVHRDRHGAATPVEARVLAHLGTPVRFDLVVKAAAADSAEMRAVHDRLRDQGLTRTPGRWFRTSPVTRAGKAVVRRTPPIGTVLAVALHGFHGTIGGLLVGNLFALPHTAVQSLPRKGKAAAAGTSGGAGCGSGHVASACGSSSCSSGGGGCGGGGGS
ncbi:TIGR04222 domain-containing membrane protein [Streptomyces sp. ID05-26A]|nr:TIGR04222 domain-containing membrane protein [Streptomyces sp. ID05-26A]